MNVKKNSSLLRDNGRKKKQYQYNIERQYKAPYTEKATKEEEDRNDQLMIRQLTMNAKLTLRELLDWSDS